MRIDPKTKKCRVKKILSFLVLYAFDIASGETSVIMDEDEKNMRWALDECRRSEIEWTPVRIDISVGAEIKMKERDGSDGETIMFLLPIKTNQNAERTYHVLYFVCQMMKEEGKNDTETIIEFSNNMKQLYIRLNTKFSGSRKIEDVMNTSLEKRDEKVKLSDNRPFPIQPGQHTDESGNIQIDHACTIPWWLAQVAYETYRKQYPERSLERVAVQGGFTRNELIELIRQKP